MDNPEEVMQILEHFSKQKQKDINHFPVAIPRELEEYINYVARTGDPLYSWSLVKNLFREKLLSVITEFYNDSPNLKDLPQYPNVDPFNYEAMKKMLIEKLDSFNSAPFTIQRICELLGEPRKQYTRIDKFMRAVEKNILVVSTQEPGRNRTESENGDSLNGDLSSEVNVDIDMENESAFVITAKDSSMTQTHNDNNHELTTVTHESMSLKKAGNATETKDEENISITIDTTTTTVTKDEEKKEDENSDASQDSSNSSSSSSDETVTTCTTFSLAVETHKTANGEASSEESKETVDEKIDEIAKETPVSIDEPEKIEVETDSNPILIEVQQSEKIDVVVPEILPVDVKIDESDIDTDVSVPPVAEEMSEKATIETENEEITVEQENKLLAGSSPKRLKIEEITEPESMEKTDEIENTPAESLEEPETVEVVPEISLPSEGDEKLEETEKVTTEVAADVDDSLKEATGALKQTEWMEELKESGVEIEEIKESTVEIEEVQAASIEIQELEEKSSEEVAIVTEPSDPIVAEPVETEPVEVEATPIVVESVEGAVVEEIVPVEMDTLISDQKMALDEDESVISGNETAAPTKMDTDDIEMEIDESNAEEAMDQ